MLGAAPPSLPRLRNLPSTQDMRTLHRTVRRGALLALGTALSAAQSHAQGAGRVITQADYDIWRSIQGTTLSRDGRWLAYSLVPAVGDGDLVVRSTKGSTEWRVPRGYVGRPQLQPNADSGFTAPPPQFSHDGRVLQRCHTMGT